MLEKLELVEVDEEDTSRLRLKFPPAPRSGTYPVIMDGVGKTFPSRIDPTVTKTIFKNCSLTIERGDKVAFVGRNGEGKSTLVKCIMGELEHEGTIQLGHNVQIGYFAQNQAALLDESLSVFETIDNIAQGEIRKKITDLLGSVHVRWRGKHQESEGAERWRENPSRHTEAPTRASKSAHT